MALPVLHIANIVNKKLLSEFSLELHLCDDKLTKNCNCDCIMGKLLSQHKNGRRTPAHTPKGRWGREADEWEWGVCKVVACNHNT